MRASAVRCTSESWRLRYSIRSAMVAIFTLWRAANSSRSGSRAMVPSSRRISQMTPAGAKPARRARSTAPSVCPARTSTPPRRARSGKTCPGLTMSAGVASARMAVRMVVARSTAEMPRPMPWRASTETVNAVPSGARFSLTIIGRPSWSQRRSVSDRQTSPRPWVAMKLMCSAVTRSAATQRSPSFSRSSSSMRMTMRPARISASASSMPTTYGLWRRGDIDPSDDRRGVGTRPALARVLLPDLRGREDVLGNDGQAGEDRGLERRGPGMRACDPPPGRLEDALLDRPPLEVDEPQLAHAEGRVRVRFRGPIVGGGPGGERFDHEVRRVEATRIRRSQPLRRHQEQVGLEPGLPVGPPDGGAGHEELAGAGVGIEVPAEDPVQVGDGDVVRTGRWRNHVQHPRDELVVSALGRRLELPELLQRVATHQRGGRGGVGSHATDATPAVAPEAMHGSRARRGNSASV